MLVLGLTMCLVFMLGIAIASPANTARAEETDLHIPVSSITATSNYEVEKTTTVAITDELVPVTDLVKVFNETAQEPTFGGTLVRDSDFEVSYAVKVGAGGALDFSEKPVNAGTYIVTVTGKGAYEGSFTKEFVIAKAGGPAAPILKGYAPTTVGGSDGKITGTTKDMEYDVDSLFTNPKDCSDGETTGFTEGTYFVRIKETDEPKTILVNYLPNSTKIPPLAKSLLGCWIGDEVPFQEKTYIIEAIQK